jgi:hypothetical protein
VCKLLITVSLTLTIAGGLARPAWGFQPVLLPAHSLRADGTSEQLLALYLVDGDALETALPEVRAARGQIVGAPQKSEDGGFRLRYRPPRVSAPSTDTLTVSAGGKSRAVTVRLVPGGRVRLEVSLHPDPLLLEKGAKAEVRVRVRDASGQPVRAPLRIGASVGRLSRLEEVTLGEYRASYTPPVERFPQVAIVAVLSVGDGAFAATPLKLAARVTLDGEGEPGASMRVIVDGRSFGPQTIGADGKFALPLVVGPGGRAIGVSQDKLGNEIRRPVDLRLPPFPRLLLAAVPSELPADGRARAEVVAFAVDARGAPVRLRAPPLSADRGTLSAPSPREGGIWSWSFTAPARPGEGPVRLRAGQAETRIALRAAPPFHLTWRAPAEPLAAGVAAPQSVEVALSDDGGQPVAGARLDAALVSGQVLGIDDLQGGRYRIRVKTPPDPGRQSAALHVELEGLEPGPPRRVTLHPARAKKGRVAAEAWVDDDLGLPVPGVVVALDGPDGRAEVTSDRYGTARLELIRPKARQFEITAQLDALPDLQATLDYLDVGGALHAVASERDRGVVEHQPSPPGASLDVEVPLRPGAPVDLRLTVEPEAAPKRSARVRIALVDAAGHPEKGAIVYQASAGTLELLHPLAHGQAELRFTPPAGARPGTRFLVSVTETRTRVTAFTQVVAR